MVSVVKTFRRVLRTGRVCGWYLKHHGVKRTSSEVLRRLQAKVGVPSQPESIPGLRNFLRSSQKLLVINAGFKFDKEINQRCIALAKEAANEGISVVFVAWEWWPGELSASETGRINDRLFQIAPRQFSLALDTIAKAKIPEKIFLLTVPNREMALKITEAQEKGFHVIYDIFDDWESFNQVGQAPWYETEIEHHAVLNADKVTVVSPRLGKLFEPLRSDISIVPNGYTPRGLIQNKGPSSKTIGYFGHLADGWFDWELVFGIARRLPELSIEIIGSGHSQETEIEARKYPNVKLLGPKPYADLPFLTCSWSLGIIPFKKSRLSECVDPLKVYEYLELGLICFSTGMPHLGQYPNCFHVEDLDHLTALIEAHARGSLGRAMPEELTAFLAQAQWSERLREVLK